MKSSSLIECFNFPFPHTKGKWLKSSNITKVSISLTHYKLELGSHLPHLNNFFVLFLILCTETQFVQKFDSAL